MPSLVTAICSCGPGSCLGADEGLNLGEYYVADFLVSDHFVDQGESSLTIERLKVAALFTLSE